MRPLGFVASYSGFSAHVLFRWGCHCALIIRLSMPFIPHGEGPDLELLYFCNRLSPAQVEGSLRLVSSRVPVEIFAHTWHTFLLLVCHKSPIILVHTSNLRTMRPRIIFMLCHSRVLLRPTPPGDSDWIWITVQTMPVCSGRQLPRLKSY